MQRKAIIFLCILNAAIALSALAYFLPKLVNKPTRADTPLSIEANDPLSDDELWTKALESSTARETHHYLQQIADTAFTLAAIKAQLIEPYNRENAGADLSRIERHSAFITAYAQAAAELDDFDLLIMLACDKAHPLTLRESALRNYIQGYVKRYKAEVSTHDENLPTTTPELLECYALIDSAYTDTDTSLLGLAIQADWYLEQNDMLTDERRTKFHAAMKAQIANMEALQSNQLTCLELLSAPEHHELISNAELYALYAHTNADTVKAAILNYFATKKDASTADWISEQRPNSPKLEQLQLTALSALQSSKDGS